MKTQRNQADGAANMAKRKATRGASQWMMITFPGGHEAELYRASNGDVRCAWPSNRPDFTKRHIREAILVHWHVALAVFTDQFGPADRVIGGP